MPNSTLVKQKLFGRKEKQTLSSRTAEAARRRIVAYRKDDESFFLEPDIRLAEFLLGPGAKADDLLRRRDLDFYVLPEQHREFHWRLRQEQGKALIEIVHLCVTEINIFCLCCSSYDKEHGEYTGLLVRLEGHEDWISPDLLAETGWAYYRETASGATSYASLLDAKLVGRERIELLGRSRLKTHWLDLEERNEFIERLAEQQTFTDNVRFRHSNGNTIDAEVHARFLPSPQKKGTALEAIWRDVTQKTLEKDARDIALQLRDRTKTLQEFERGIVEVVARQCKLGAAAFYRFKSAGNVAAHFLRAEIGLPEGFSLPRRLSAQQIDGQSSDPLRLLPEEVQRFYSKTARVQEYLLAMSLEFEDRIEPIGCIWAPIIKDVELARFDTGARVYSAAEFERWLEVLSTTLAEIVPRAELDAARAAGIRALNRALELFASGKTGFFYEDFLRLLLEEVPAEGGSIFLIEKTRHKVRLRLSVSTGIAGLGRSRWDAVTYQLGEGFTGGVGASEKPTVILDVGAERENLELKPVSDYPEILNNRARTWLGFPIRSSRQRLSGVVRLANRKSQPPFEPTGFTDGDLKVVEELCKVAGKFQDLEGTQKEHQAAIVRSQHELRAPVVAIRSHARYLIEQPNSHAAEVKHRNIVTDAELILDLLDRVDLLDRIDDPSEDRLPRKQKVKLYADVINPLRYGLREEAKRYGHEYLTISAETMRKLPPLLLDKGMMRQVFSNLFINAIKYGPETSGKLLIEVDWKREENVYQIFVRDWGMGIQKGTARRIFRKHFRSPMAIIRHPNGTGLGLYLVRNLVELHGGGIRLRRRISPTEFLLTLPLGEVRS